MHLPAAESPPDTPTQRRADRRRLLCALNLSLAFVLVLVAVFTAQGHFDVPAWAVQPGSWQGWRGLLAAPLLHGSPAHLATNAFSLLLLGTLAGVVYPRATLRALPLVWLGSGLGAWLLGAAGSHHLGASGLTHGLMFLLLGLGLLRRDRPAIAAAMIAFMLYGGMLLTILPREPGISWQAHLGGAVAGAIAAWVFRKLDPVAPRKRYSWEEEDDGREPLRDELERTGLEPASPHDVPVLWKRPAEVRGTVLRFPSRDEE